MEEDGGNSYVDPEEPRGPQRRSTRRSRPTEYANEWRQGAPQAPVSDAVEEPVRKSARQRARTERAMAAEADDEQLDSSEADAEVRFLQ